ncbi:phosphate regulon sensor histidine kinase PhoR [Pseudomarimonas salicorniae]|uniref:Phosphate regulon sensor protein PhoR n=1 Tax=Pseudomarimonas salicorniae TaxID=2933270 RepID=A0ABT0GEK1_9GAMM|nr:phosphate regulon sensor histidine kinase PhoR [Lysobacter sp. CAU 1642]MCK7592589.1 phosphate regulon sensor histidine kinase PhoR [Lysobacter sp. CAU 1642]
MNWIPGRAWQHSLWRLAGWLLLCAVAGGVFGRPLAGLSLGLAGALGWHYWQIHRLLRQLGSRRAIASPEGWGVFSEIQAQLFRRQRESRQRKRRLQSLLHAFREAAAALPDGVLVVSRRDGRIAWFNESATRLLGLRHPDDLGARLTHLLRAPRVVEWLSGDASEPLIDLPSPVDPQRRLLLRLADYTSEQKLLIARDVSKLMQLEQVRRDFVANVSHELRTPLTVIHGYLDMLDGEDNPELAGLLDEMRSQSARMNRIVEDLLTLSRLESMDRVPSERVPMQPLLQALRRDAEALSSGRHRISLDEHCPCDLLGSSKELQSAFSNLVSNAVRYTPAGGEVRIRFAREADGGARLSVSDSGPGIAPQHLPRITERFYRVSNSRSRDTGGTGLGLAIVKHALNLHHARLEIESELGRGSTFSCVFAPEQVAAQEQDAA